MSAPVVLVTGVTSTVGKAIVRRLAFSGYNVAAADRCSGDVSEVAADNKKEFEKRVRLRDLLKRNWVRRFVDVLGRNDIDCG
ncbi:unnamed protein product [Angiostrongylus costaricensis]|uniref:Epimerase domain-containing protein n=1 Tax=Angiostrongylus costaricensis TaxID=334426 RepID=A0A0R3PDI0_ANGCS|nr:unnamed protein product [Angiostrongylus costaricensis]